MTDYTFYKEGFFGYGESGSFSTWSFAHICPIVIAIGLIVLIYFLRNKIKTWKHEENFRFIYAIVMLFIEMSYFWRVMYVGGSDYDNYTLIDRLPLQVCQWTLFICSFMMMKKSKNLFNMVYFLTLSTNIFACLFPAVLTKTGPAYFRYYQFWLEHLMPIVGMFYMMFVFDFKPHLIGILFDYIMLFTMLPFALILNTKYDACNYLYLKRDETFAMLDFLPDTQIGTAAFLCGLIAVVFAVDYLIYFLITKKISNRKLVESHE